MKPSHTDMDFVLTNVLSNNMVAHQHQTTILSWSSILVLWSWSSIVSKFLKLLGLTKIGSPIKIVIWFGVFISLISKYLGIAFKLGIDLLLLSVFYVLEIIGLPQSSHLILQL